MPTKPDDWSSAQAALWQHVCESWAVAQTRDAARIAAGLHPAYVGWDMSAPLPHDRDAAVASVIGCAPRVDSWELLPLSVQIYGGRVGVVHYTYSATVVPAGKGAMTVTGKWSEVYLKQGGSWLMISVSGRPDPV
ncbi:nuclear transport factor 2 family protein [Thauera propionica]|uniref:nuclear transport factor 2 family protein n=1 Tax=Thauera propionica TaxID=2019431 RepID=UPI0023F1C943|nr:nuclear transport factor 2 family protein [Thauera propionica]MDD3676703.1 nuclear transport factor 2 family protein [Thauera propionica]